MDEYFKEIERKRKFNYSLDLGERWANKTVSVTLKNHRFLFGTNAFDLLSLKKEELLEQYKQIFSDVFNTATLPFYWGRYEPEEGKPRFNEISVAAEWLVDNGITVKGHPLCWHTACADWLLQYDDDTIFRKQMDRISRDVEAFQSKIGMWDVINEVVIMPKFDRYDNGVTRIAKKFGAEELTVSCFKKAKEANPQAKLLINDFDLSEDYESLIERLLDKGCPIDIIGLQSHQHQGYRGAEYFTDVVERFSRFGLPLHFTEMTLISGELAPPHIVDLNDAYRENWPSTPEGEERHSREVAEIYSLLYSFPQVDAIVWWDMRDGNWLNAPSGLLRRDMSPKPAFLKLKDLINNTWGFPRTDIAADKNGIVSFRGPEGCYHVELDGRISEVDLNCTPNQCNIKIPPNSSI